MKTGCSPSNPQGGSGEGAGSPGFGGMVQNAWLAILPLSSLMKPWVTVFHRLPITVILQSHPPCLTGQRPAHTIPPQAVPLLSLAAFFRPSSSHRALGK